MNKYFNDAVIGNKNITASYTKKGELLRITYPTPDYKQLIDFFHTGVKINDSNIIYLHDDINNVYNQYYTQSTNILNTEVKNTYFNLKIQQTDFVPIKQDVLVKRYTFTNENNIELDTKFLIHSKMLTNENDFTGARIIENGIIQYNHNINMVIIAKENKISSHQINDTQRNIWSGTIQDKDYIGMSQDSSISFGVGNLKPKQSTTIEILIYLHTNEENYRLEEIENAIEKVRKIDTKSQLQATKQYWTKYVKEHKAIDLTNIKIETKNKVEQIYERTILLYPLLTNEETGGIRAAVEVDENLEYCGRYTYCWPRDAVFITKALDILKMEKETEKFYKIFCKNTQSKNGMWEQRFYTDCRLAPCWGYQIDETASVVYGIYEHYLKTKNKKFLKDNLKMITKATEFLEKYIEDILSGKNKIHVSYDLWEMHEGISLYSLSSIFAAFSVMLEVWEELKDEIKENRLKQENAIKQKERLEQYKVLIKEYILTNLYDNNQKSFVRNKEDKKMDISIIGAVIPFNVFTPKEKKITNTIEKINLTLRTYTGGYKRFEKDHYKGGNPWVIATLWMALYYLEIKETKKALECFNYVVKTSTEHGFLAEQINNDTMKPEWVIGLGWSHAMFMIVLEKLGTIGDV